MQRTGGAPLTFTLATPDLVNPVVLRAPDGYGGTMLTFAGDSAWTVNAPLDPVDEQTGWGNDTVSASIDYTLPAAVEDLVLLAGAGDGTGNSLRNHVTGNADANRLIGLANTDTLTGGDGNDTLNSGNGNDQLIGGTGNDVLIGGGGIDSFTVDAGADRIRDLGLGGRETVAIAAGASAAITLAADWQASAATVNAGAATITLQGHALNLNDVGGPSGWLATNAGDATPVRLVGSAAGDTLTGGTGNDTISGGDGIDSLAGGTGADRFNFRIGGTEGDSVADFVSGSDRLIFIGFGTKAAGAALTRLNATDWQITPAGGGTPETIHLLNAPNLLASDWGTG